jgi:hypothetical protein
MPDARPISVLVASSTEVRIIARDLRTRLPEDWSVVLWDESVIRPGQSVWEGLIDVCRAIDVAVLLLTADDVLEQRGRRQAVPRDNLIFEAGLCMGLLGPERTLLVQQLDLGPPTTLRSGGDHPSAFPRAAPRPRCACGARPRGQRDRTLRCTPRSAACQRASVSRPPARAFR